MKRSRFFNDNRPNYHVLEGQVTAMKINVCIAALHALPFSFFPPTTIRTSPFIGTLYPCKHNFFASHSLPPPFPFHTFQSSTHTHTNRAFLSIIHSFNRNNHFFQEPKKSLTTQKQNALIIDKSYSSSSDHRICCMLPKMIMRCFLALRH